jgi:toxin ParE1/3/4
VKPILFTESALVDLEDILVWHSKQQVPDVGKRLVQEIIAKVEQLSDYPESGRIVSEFEMKTVRELIQPPFRVVYRLDTEKIWIIQVWRSERLLALP